MGTSEAAVRVPAAWLGPPSPANRAPVLPRKSSATFQCQGLAEALPGWCLRWGWHLAEGSPQMPSRCSWLLPPESQQTSPPSSPPASSYGAALCGGPVATGQLSGAVVLLWSSSGPAWLPGAAAPYRTRCCAGRADTAAGRDEAWRMLRGCSRRARISSCCRVQRC